MDFSVFRKVFWRPWAADIQGNRSSALQKFRCHADFHMLPYNSETFSTYPSNFAWPVLLILAWRVVKITIFIPVFLCTGAALL